MGLLDKGKLRGEVRDRLDTFPCFLCGDRLPVKLTIKNKPYFVCDSCGLQAFIRREKGIHRLKTLCESQKVGSNKDPRVTKGNLKLLKQLQEIKAGLKGIEADIWTTLKSEGINQVQPPGIASSKV
jgi:hypothetical protein